MSGFTQREKTVIELMLQGFTNDEISKRLFLAPSTVADHVQAIYQKLELEGGNKRVKAVLKLRELKEVQDV